MSIPEWVARDNPEHHTEKAEIPATVPPEESKSVTSDTEQELVTTEPEEIVSPTTIDTEITSTIPDPFENKPIIMEAILAMSFRGKKNENVEDFITSIKVNFAPKGDAFKTKEEKEEALLASLKGKIKGKAATWAFRQPQTMAESWEKMTQALRDRYANQS